MKKHNKSHKKKKSLSADLSTMSVDEFMNGIGDSSEDEDLLDEGSANQDEDSSQSQHTTQRTIDEEHSQEEDGNYEGTNETDSEEHDSEVDPKTQSSQLKESLNKLKDTDPEFYKFLEQHDESLLKFDLSDASDSEDEDEESQIHIPSDKLEGDSDESDFEDGITDSHREYGKKLTLKIVEELQQKLQDDKTVSSINEVIEAFHAAVQRVSPDSDTTLCRYKVDGSGVFNSVVQLCVLELLPAVKKFLKLPAGSSFADLSRVKKWVKIRGSVKKYLADLLVLLGGLTSVDTISLLLKHVHQLSPFVVKFKTLRRHFLRKLISLWGEGEDTIRVLAFMCVLKMTTLCQKALLEKVLKVMYITYIKNSKFVSANTLPGINFMRRSLNEMLLLDENVTYTLAFLYIRQLAIHLRNGIVIHKKESIQAVYNWQYMASLSLWTELLSVQNKPVLVGLRFPLVQLIIGTAKLYPTPEYYPLKFHCIRLLCQIARCTRTFVPALPLILEILTSYDFTKKHTKVTMKPLEFNCVLRVSAAQQNENGFKDTLVESICGTLLEYLATESHSICFPDIVLPVTLCLKKFLKQCKIANFCRKLKQVLDKIEENVKFIENQRRSITFGLSDTSAVEAWEKSVQIKGTPLADFYKSWCKINTFNEAKKKSEKFNIADSIAQMVNKKKKLRKGKSSDEGPVSLLPSDESDEEEDFFRAKIDENKKKVEKPVKAKKRQSVEKISPVRSKKLKKKMKLSKSKNEELDESVADDVVLDTKLSDW